MGESHKKWREVKAKIIVRFGSIKACAQQIDCTTEGIRKSVQGQCPRVARRLEAALQ